MIRAMVTGTLHKDPEVRVGAKGNFTTAKIKGDAEAGQVWVSIIAFQQQGERLATLRAGQAVSITGRAKLSSWLDKAGEPQAGLDIVVDELATLRARPKPKPAPAQTGFDDDLTC